MVWLTALPWWVLLPLSLVAVFAVTVAVRALLVRWLGDETGPAVATAAPLMTGFGALFAFLSAFVIATEWGTQSTADAEVAREAAASSRLAWAATAPGVDTDSVQGAIERYLDETITVEWPAMADGDHVAPTDNPAWRSLEQTARQQASASGVATPAAGEMLAALDDLAAARRERLALADRALPVPLYATLAVSGLALCVNALVLTIPHSRRTTVVVASIIAVVGLDLGLMLILGAPFRGTLTASPDLLEGVRASLTSGFFAL